jgi:hypothetical protein
VDLAIVHPNKSHVCGLTFSALLAPGRPDGRLRLESVSISVLRVHAWPHATWTSLNRTCVTRAHARPAPPVRRSHRDRSRPSLFPRASHVQHRSTFETYRYNACNIHKRQRKHLQKQLKTIANIHNI